MGFFFLKKKLVPFEAMAIGHKRQINTVLGRYSNFTISLYYSENLICNIHDGKMPRLWKALNKNGKYFGKLGDKRVSVFHTKIINIRENNKQSLKKITTLTIKLQIDQDILPTHSHTNLSEPGVTKG